MDKALFSTQFKTPEEIWKTYTFPISNKQGEFRILGSETDIMMEFFWGAAFVSEEQQRVWDNNPIETCFIVNYDKINQLKSVSVKILNFKNLMWILVFKGYDKKGLFVYEVPFDISSKPFLYQLINLFNQEFLYFHIFRAGFFYKTIIQDNPFKWLKEIEDLLSRMGEKSLLVKFDIDSWMERMSLFYSEYSNKEISCFMKEEEAYLFLH